MKTPFFHAIRGFALDLPRAQIATGSEPAHNRGVVVRSAEVLFVVGLISTVAGCSVFFSLDGYSGPPVDGGPNDGGHADGGKLDASQDSEPDSEPCPGFCDDFDDRVTPFLGKWTSLSLLNDGGPSNAFITSTQFKSPPHSAQFHSPAGDAGKKKGVLLTKDLTLLDATLILDFDVKIIRSSDEYSGYVNLLQIGLGDVYVGGLTALSSGEDADYENYADGGHVHTTSNALPGVDENWHHVHYVAVYDTTNGSVLATWDGSTVLGVTHVADYGTSPVPTDLSVSIGAAAEPPTPTMDVYIDNVVMQ